MKSRKHLPILGVPCALSLLKNLGCFKLQVRWIGQLRIFKKYWKHRNETYPTQGWGSGNFIWLIFLGRGREVYFSRAIFWVVWFSFQKPPRGTQVTSISRDENVHLMKTHQLPFLFRSQELWGVSKPGYCHNSHQDSHILQYSFIKLTLKNN